MGRSVWEKRPLGVTKLLRTSEAEKALNLSLSPTPTPSSSQRGWKGWEETPLDRINASRALLSPSPYPLACPLAPTPAWTAIKSRRRLGPDIQIEMPAARTCFSPRIVCITMARTFRLAPLFLVFLLLLFCLVCPGTAVVIDTSSCSIRFAGEGENLQPHATLTFKRQTMTLWPSSCPCQTIRRPSLCSLGLRLL